MAGNRWRIHTRQQRPSDAQIVQFHQIACTLYCATSYSRVGGVQRSSSRVKRGPDPDGALWVYTSSQAAQ